MRPNLATSKDPLDAAKLPPSEETAGMAVQHPLPLDPMNHPPGLRLAFALLLAAVPGATLVFAAVRAIDEAAGIGGAVGAGLLLGIVLSLIAFRRGVTERTFYKILFTPMAATTVLTVFSRLSLHPLDWALLVGLAGVGLMLHLVHMVARHQAMWMTCSPRLSAAERRRWQEIADRPYLLGKPVRYIRSVAVVLLTYLGLWAAVRATGMWPGSVLAFGNILAVGFVLWPAARAARTGDKGCGFSCPIYSLVNFVSYNRQGTRAPGVWQSLYGSRRRRVALAAGSLFGFGFMAAPMLFVTFPTLNYDRAVSLATFGEYYREAVLTAFGGSSRHVRELLANFFSYAIMTPFIYGAIWALVAQPVLKQFSGRMRWNLADPQGVERVWAARTEALAGSCHQADTPDGVVRECDHVYLGTAAAGDYPVLIHRSVLNEHVHVIGPTGSGKTSRALTPLCAQVMQFDPASLLVIDLRGDGPFFEGVRREAAAAGRGFKWLTLDPSRGTFAWNPLDEPFFRRMAPADRALFLAQALALNNGEGYGRSYFSESNLNLLRTLMEEFPDARSFRDLWQSAKDMKSFKAVTEKDVEDARQVLMVIRTLAEVPALNVTADAPTESARGMTLGDLIRDREPDSVVYFHLPALTTDMAGRHVARLALYGLLAAASNRGPAERAHVYLVVDEAQRIATPETLELVLQQARGFGVTTILSHQSLGDLKKPSGDLTKTVINNTRLRICFGAADPDDIDTLIRSSGEAAYETLGWTQPTQEVLDGRTGPERNAGEQFSVGQAVAARLRKNDILRMNNDAEAAWVQVVRGAGYSQFGGEPLIVRMPHYVPRAEHESRANAGWPSAAGTFVAAELALPAPAPAELPAWLTAGVAGAIPPALPAAPPAGRGEPSGGGTVPVLPATPPDLSGLSAIAHYPMPKKRGRPKKKTVGEDAPETLPLPGMEEAVSEGPSSPAETVARSEATDMTGPKPDEPTGSEPKAAEPAPGSG